MDRSVFNNTGDWLTNSQIFVIILLYSVVYHFLVFSFKTRCVAHADHSMHCMIITTGYYLRRVLISDRRETLFHPGRYCLDKEVVVILLTITSTTLIIIYTMPVRMVQYTVAPLLLATLCKAQSHSYMNTSNIL